MIRDAANINQLWSFLIIEELVRSGVKHFFISPGSRSTPLVSAVARHGHSNAVVHFDERGTAFAALGYAKASGNPAAWVTTSGTAVANGLPAVIEASMDGVPMILLTADRPHELRQTGANQSIPQFPLFSPFVKWSIDVSPPTQSIPPNYILTTIDQAIHQALRSGGGPVHVNCMFREPLAPKATGSKFDQYLKGIARWLDDINPFTQYSDTGQNGELNPGFRSGVLDSLTTQKGIIIAGRLKSKEEGVAVETLATTLNWPLYADISSQCRLGQNALNRDSTKLSPLLFSPPNQESLPVPETIIQLGKRPTSKLILSWIESVRPKYNIVVENGPERIDPRHEVTHRVESDIKSFCNYVLTTNSSTSKANSDWQDHWIRINEVVSGKLEKFLTRSEELYEPTIARIVSEEIHESNTLVIGNSMPIRDFDTAGAFNGNWIKVVTNRGASGIDGVMATAIGVGIATNKSVTVVIGDLGVLHDLNSLAMASQLSSPFVVVIINNDGGGIFSFLPIAEYEEIFEPFFGTPHGLAFGESAKMFGAKYFNPSTVKEFRTCYSSAINESGFSLIEVKTNRDENYLIHKEIEQLTKI